MGGHDGAVMGGEDRAAPQAIDHLGADLALQRRHMMAERRLDDTQPVRRGRQAADVRSVDFAAAAISRQAVIRFIWRSAVPGHDGRHDNEAPHAR